SAVADVRRANDAPGAPVIFTHVLSVTPAARRRFNVGPLTPPRDRGSPVALTFDASDWDRSTAMNAPGQSESPDSAHYADLARVWASGGSIPLPFTDAAVQRAAESTLVLVPPR